MSTMTEDQFWATLMEVWRFNSPYADMNHKWRTIEALKWAWDRTDAELIRYRGISPAFVDRLRKGQRNWR